LAGDLAAARRARDEAGESRYAAPVIALYEGRFDEARALWEAQREENQRAGNRRDEMMSTLGLGMLQRLEGEPEAAEELLEAALATAVDGGERIAELWIRTELAVTLADAGRSGEARVHLARGEALATEEEDWRGLAGRLALAQAAVLSAEDRPREAAEQCTAAAETFRRWQVPWDEAEAMRRSGLARLRIGDRNGAVQRLAGAVDLYRRHGGPTRWIEPVLAEKLGAQGIDTTERLTSVHLVAAAVESERPDLAPLTSPEGTVTLLFSDIEGSTAANERLGDRRWMEVLHAHNLIVREEVARHGGFEVKSQGDGFMLAFSSARRGLACAVAIQQALRAHAGEHPDAAIAVRMGLHTGEAVKEGDDFFGTHVALAARVATAARGGEILVSALLKELTEGSGELAFRPSREVELKGLTGTRRVYSVLWEADATKAAAMAPAASPPASLRRRRLVTVLATDLADDDRLAEAVEGRGEIVPLDDGALIAFSSAADALACAVRLQRSPGNGSDPAPPRVGLHAGDDPGVEGAGPNPVAGVAQALSQIARPGQVVCSEIVARLLAGRPRFAFASLGTLEAGAERALSAYEARFETGDEAFVWPVPLTGRQAEMARLLERLQEAAAGRGGLLMLAGEQASARPAWPMRSPPGRSGTGSPFCGAGATRASGRRPTGRSSRRSKPMSPSTIPTSCGRTSVRRRRWPS
jgi:class 3 adenylate cyclase